MGRGMSTSGPLVRAGRAALLVAAGVAVSSLVALVSRVPYLEERVGLGFLTLGAAVALAVLGFQATRGSKAALAAAVALLGAAALAAAVRAVLTEGRHPVWPVPVCLLALVPLASGLTPDQERR